MQERWLTVLIWQTLVYTKAKKINSKTFTGKSEESQFRGSANGEVGEENGGYQWGDQQ